MPRPWDKYLEDNRKLPDYFGPDKSSTGITRDQFYDQMVKNGWNRGADDDMAIICIYCLFCANGTDNNAAKIDALLQKIQNTPVKSLQDRWELLKPLTSQPMPSSLSMNAKKVIHGTFINYGDLINFNLNMVKAGWDQEKDADLINIFSKLPNKKIDNYSNQPLYEAILFYDPKNPQSRVSLLERVQRFYFNLTSDEKTHITKQELDKLTELKTQYKKEAEAAEKNRELQANPVLRNLFDQICEKGLSSVSDDTTQKDPVWGTNLTRAESLVCPAYYLDPLKQYLETLQIDEKNWKNSPNLVRDQIKAGFRTAMMKGNLFFSKTPKLTDLEEAPYRDLFLNDNLSVKQLKDELLRTASEVMSKRYSDIVMETDRITSPALYAKSKRIHTLVMRMAPIIHALHDKKNRAYLDARNAGKTGEDIPVYYSSDHQHMITLEKLSNAQCQELNALIEYMGSMDPKPEKLGDLFQKDILNSPLIAQIAEPVKDEDLEKLQDQLQKIKEIPHVSLNFLRQTGVYRRYLTTQNVEEGGPYDPLAIAEKSMQGEDALRQLKTELSTPNLQQALRIMEDLTETLRNPNSPLMTVRPDEMISYFNSYGVDLLIHSPLCSHSYAMDKTLEGVNHYFTFSDVPRDKTIDRDRLSDLDMKKIKELVGVAHTYYKQNQDDLDEMLDNLYSSKNFENTFTLEVEKHPELQNKLINFFKLVSNIPSADPDICKVIDRNTGNAMEVSPLKENCAFNREFINNEKELLENCYEMLYQPSTRVWWNSSAYKTIMSSLSTLKNDLGKEYPNDGQRRATYEKNLQTVLNNISKYQIHKATDTIKNDATREKLIAVERVEKLLSVRLKSLNGPAYAKRQEKLKDVIDVRIENNKVGDEYLYDKAIAKIQTVKKNMARIQIASEAAPVGPSRQSIQAGAVPAQNL